MDSRYLGLKETMKYLSVSKSEIEQLVRGRRLTAYKLGGSHLRFRKDQLLILKNEMEGGTESPSLFGTQRMRQFWAFNSFYIVASILLSGLLVYFIKA